MPGQDVFGQGVGRVDLKLVFLLLAGFLGLILVVGVFTAPLKFFLRLGFYAVAGWVILTVANFLLDRCGLHIALNPVTLLTAGVLHLPGVILLALLDYLFT
ncbi:SigmaK-factor processing regulatory BofA [Desulfofundulus thermobenzoicus]|uniref:SigmaK-factor processing regulatory BofA n=1 Tax=Desulfofundulus thermobenzoicus TaxID=29376 RepID=A0A6N7IRY3_9FIRM|nr:SigmaK-factor processing regulatory BofA [Desulfofundulus thermobenzoicus]HHW44639.1 SigmaK-factor processing regulatory BofA [Desulfotomaculum sp.]